MKKAVRGGPWGSLTIFRPYIHIFSLNNITGLLFNHKEHKIQMTEKLNIKVFLGDNPTPEDFSFSQLSTKTGSILPTTSNDLFFSSDKVIPFQTFETEEERIRVLTNSSVFSSNIKNSIKVPKQEEIRTFNNNIITVLFFLFPTFYNSTPNIHNSFDDKVPHNGVAKIDAPVLKKNKKMANLTDGIVYYKENTVVQLTWKNDVFNVPEFQQLFSAIYGFYVWSKTEGTQKINADLQKIVENLVDPRNVIAQALERENTAILDDKSNPFSSSSSRYETKSNIPVGEIERVKEAFTKLKTNYDTLKGQYDTRKKELATESKEKNPVEKTKESKQKYDIVLKTTVQTITEQIAILKYFDETYSQSQTTPAVSIVKRTIERFSNLITNRTLNDAFIILDEAQNTSAEQMKMFLTRLGFGSKMVITGDTTQVDLPHGAQSGLRIVHEILDGLADIEFINLLAEDVVRNRLVGEIVSAYARFDDGKATPPRAIHTGRNVSGDR